MEPSSAYDSTEAQPGGPAKPEPSNLLAVLAALLPLVSMFGSVLLLFVVAGGEMAAIARFAEETGAWFFLIVVIAFVAALVSGVLLFFAGRGVRIPALVTVGVATLPWLVGILATLSSARMVREAVAFADPESRAALVARGIAEASNGRALGAWMGAALLAGVAIALALAALGQRAPGRRPVASLAGVVGLVAFGVPAAFAILGASTALVLVLPVVAGAAVVALAAAAAGADSPHGRSAALAAAAPVAAGLSFVGAAVTVTTMGMSEVFAALSMVAPEDRTRIVASAAAEIAPLQLAADWGGPAALVPIAIVGAWALMRTRPSGGRIAAGAVLLVLSAAFVHVDRAANGSVGEDLSAATAPAWSAIPDFQPVVMQAYGGTGEVDAIVTVGGVVSPEGGPPAPLGDRAAIAAVLRSRMQRPRGGLFGEEYVEEEQVPREVAPDPARDEAVRLGILGVLGQQVEEGLSPAGRIASEPCVVLAVDGRVPADVLRVVIGAASDAGARSIRFAGKGTGGPSPDEVEEVRRVLPLLSGLMSRQASLDVLLEGALPAGYADADETLYHATIGSAPVADLGGRSGTQPQLLPLPAPGEQPVAMPREEEGTVSYLALGAGATAAGVIDVAARAALRGLRPLVLAGAIPGNPDRPASRGSAIGLGPLLGTLGEAGGEPGLDAGAVGGSPEGEQGRGGGFGQGEAGDFRLRNRQRASDVQMGTADVRGSLSPEVIRRIVRQHTGEVRYCYEQGLSRRPDLEGRMSVQFVVAIDGSVSMARVQSSTLGDTQVEECVARSVRRWQFPRPEGGGIVIVTYPFILQSSR